MIKHWVEKLFSKTSDMEERLFRIILTLGIFVVATAIIAGVNYGLSVIPLLPAVAAIVIVYRLVFVKEKISMAAWLMEFVFNGYLFPLMFFRNGGIESGTAIWFVMGMVYAFLLFSGKALYIAIGFSVFSYGMTYYLSWIFPQWLNRMDSEFSIYADSFFSVLLVGFAIGIIFKFYVGVYEKEKELSARQKEEIERISQSKDAFFANMSHEIRTPINTIIGLNEMILREDISDEIAENAVNIQNASKMLLALINDILDLSKLESGKMEIVPNQYETGAMFSDLVNIIWIRAHEKKLEFKIDIDKDIPSMLYGDEVRLKQVITNILTNAVKYTEKGSVTLTAKGERYWENRVRLRISVEDTGMGIRKESLNELFSSFRRVDQAKNRNIEGTGLGLSISKQLIEMMGGQITVDSIYKRGSTFTITVDQQIVNASPVGSMDFMLKKKIYNREKYKQSFEAPDARVLVVDDNEMNLMVACKLLRATKVQIDTALSGKECLEKTMNKSYHVIFMDHMMPEMDGEETLQKLRKQENGRCQDTPVIALTANVMAGAEKLYQQKGFEGYLAKPINGALIEATLLKYLPAELIETSAMEEEEGELADETIKMVSAGRKKHLLITTDCVCDLPEKLVEQYDIKMMYYYVYTNQGRFCDGKEICSDNLLRYMQEEKNRAHSSCASVEEYESFFAEALGEGEKIIHISMASRSSEGFQTASLAAKGFDNVIVVDSGHLSSGMGMMVLAAAKLVQEGKSAEAVCRMLEGLKGRVSTSFIVPSPDSLYRNGKIGKGVKKLCDFMNLHPVLYLAQNKIKLCRVEMGSTEVAYKKYIRHQLRRRDSIDTRILFLTYAGCSVKLLNEIEAEVRKYVEFEHIEWQKASATISSNCGIGAFGLLFIRNG